MRADRRGVDPGSAAACPTGPGSPDPRSRVGAGHGAKRRAPPVRPRDPDMLGFELTEHATWISVSILALGCVGVWRSGVRLAVLGDVISERTGLGRAFTGALLLGVATSLPELATTLTASIRGAGALAGSNLLGGVAMQLAVLAVVDGVALRGRALTFFSPQPVLLLQGVLLIVLIALATAALATDGGYAVAGVGLWSPALFGFYLVALWVHYRYEGGRPRWEALQPDELPDRPPSSPSEPRGEGHFSDQSLRWVSGRFALWALGVLVSGYVVARAGEALAEQTGLGGTFVGATLVAVATSLPELSTTLTAVRAGAYAMAIGNIFGTNALEVALLPIADVAYRDGSIYGVLDTSAVLLCALGIVATGLYLWGLLERRDRTVMSFGQDSLLVLLTYVAGMVVFYFER